MSFGYVNLKTGEVLEYETFPETSFTLTPPEPETDFTVTVGKRSHDFQMILKDNYIMLIYLGKEYRLYPDGCYYFELIGDTTNNKLFIHVGTARTTTGDYPTIFSVPVGMLQSS